MVVTHGRRYAATPVHRRRPTPVRPDRAEELANTITHGAGLVLSIVGLYALVLITAESRSPGLALGCAIYGVTLVLLHAASTLYHGWQDERTKRVLLLLDHIGIYIMIAGTYTPLALIPLKGAAGQVLLVVVWGSALVGSAVKVIRFDRLDADSPMPYVVLSCMQVAFIDRFYATSPPAGFFSFLAGSAFYAIGLRFFIRDNRFDHAIWHVFSLAGSICQYAAVIVFATSAAA